MQVYEADEDLRKLLGAEPKSLSVAEKYQVLSAYNKGGVAGLIGESGAEGGAAGAGEGEESIIIHNGKKFRRVQIEGEAQDFNMDEEGNIYDLEFNFIGQANGSDDEN